MCALCKLSSFFLQSAVTQSRAVHYTKTVNMTWKAPMYGLTNVAFWYVLTLILILAATFMFALCIPSKGCPECQQSSCTVLRMLYCIAGKFHKVYSLKLLQVDEIHKMFSTMYKADFQCNCKILTQNLWFWTEAQNFLAQFFLYTVVQQNVILKQWCCFAVCSYHTDGGKQWCECQCYSECYWVLFMESCTYVCMDLPLPF